MSSILKENNVNLEKCKKALMDRSPIPMLSIKNIIVGSVGTVVPWIILLILVSIIIII
jgi:hypothetical protein